MFGQSIMSDFPDFLEHTDIWTSCPQNFGKDGKPEVWNIRNFPKLFLVGSLEFVRTGSIMLLYIGAAHDTTSEPIKQVGLVVLAIQ